MLIGSAQILQRFVPGGSSPMCVSAITLTPSWPVAQPPSSQWSPSATSRPASTPRSRLRAPHRQGLVPDIPDHHLVRLLVEAVVDLGREDGEVHADDCLAGFGHLAGSRASAFVGLLPGHDFISRSRMMREFSRVNASRSSILVRSASMSAWRRIFRASLAM